MHPDLVISEQELPLSLRRAVAPLWPDLSNSFLVGLGKSLVGELEPSPLLSIHPEQSDATLQGAIGLTEELEAALRELSGLIACGWGALSCSEAIEMALVVANKWKEMRPGTPRNQAVWIHASAEKFCLPEFVQSDTWVTIEAESIRKEMSRLLPLKGTTLFLSNAAVEALGPALAPMIATTRSLGALCGLGQTDLKWIACGFSPGTVGLDFAVFDLSEWNGDHPNSPSLSQLHLLTVSTEGEPYMPKPRWRHTSRGFERQTDRILSVGWGEGPLPSLPSISAVYAELRLLGGAGLKRLSERAALYAVYLHQQLSHRLGAEKVHSSYHEVFVPGKGLHFRPSGRESRDQLNAWVEIAG